MESKGHDLRRQRSNVVFDRRGGSLGQKTFSHKMSSNYVWRHRMTFGQLFSTNMTIFDMSKFLHVSKMSKKGQKTKKS
jgi:hypothetical protein